MPMLFYSFYSHRMNTPGIAPSEGNSQSTGIDAAGRARTASFLKGLAIAFGAAALSACGDDKTIVVTTPAVEQRPAPQPQPTPEGC